MTDLIKQINKWNKIVHINLLKFIKANKKYNIDFFMDPEDLTGACALGSYILSTKLHQEKIKNQVIVGKYKNYMGDHCWVESVGKIFDPTFKQIKFNKAINCVNKDHKNYFSKEKVGLKSKYNWDEWEGQNPNLYKWNWSDSNLEIYFSKFGKEYFNI